MKRNDQPQAHQPAYGWYFDALGRKVLRSRPCAFIAELKRIHVMDIIHQLRMVVAVLKFSIQLSTWGYQSLKPSRRDMPKA